MVSMTAFRVVIGVVILGFRRVIITAIFTPLSAALWTVSVRPFAGLVVSVAPTVGRTFASVWFGVRGRSYLQGNPLFRSCLWAKTKIELKWKLSLEWDLKGQRIDGKCVNK